MTYCAGRSVTGGVTGIGKESRTAATPTPSNAGSPGATLSVAGDDAFGTPWSTAPGGPSTAAAADAFACEPSTM